MDDLATFVHTVPAWVGPDGFPISWRHFVVGLRMASRFRARDRLDIASGAGAATAKEDAHEAWYAATKADAGWA